jgi:hypothetical protein
VYIFVTEDFSERLRVKAERDDHPEGDVRPVMKLDAVRDFNTGIYDYSVMTSTFLRVREGWPVSKVSFSSQEWCGQQPPYRLIRQTGADGEELALRGSARLAYWRLNTLGGESYLDQIGLGDD